MITDPNKLALFTLVRINLEIVQRHGYRQRICDTR